MQTELESHASGLGAAIVAEAEADDATVGSIVASLDAPESDIIAAIEELQDIGEIEIEPQVSVSSNQWPRNSWAAREGSSMY